MMNFINNRKKKGFTLIELMIVLALIVIAIVVVMTQFGDASRQSQARQALQELSQLKGAVQALRAPNDGWAAIAAAADASNVLMNSAGVPSTMVRNGALKTPEGQSITVLGGPTSYTIDFSVEDPKLCQEIISKNLGSGWKELVAGGSVSSGGGTADPTITGGTPQTSAVTAQTACASATAASPVKLIFRGQ